MLLAATVVTAQNLDIIKQRRAAMNAIASAGLMNFKMTRGELPFDLDKLQANLKTLQAEVQRFKTLFPDDSKTGGGTDASERIWQARAAFDAASDRMLEAARNAAALIYRRTKPEECLSDGRKDLRGMSQR